MYVYSISDKDHKVRFAIPFLVVLHLNITFFLLPAHWNHLYFNKIGRKN